MKSRFAFFTAYCVASVACLNQGMNVWTKIPHSHLDVQYNHAVVQPSATAPIRQAGVRHPEPTPTFAYQKQSIHGFTISIHPLVLTYPQEARAMQAELTTQLAAISQVIPAKPLTVLRQVWIWVEWDNHTGAAEFHPSAAWLSP